MNNKSENHIVNVESKNLIDNGAKSIDISISVLNETSKENRIEILINENAKV